MIENCEFIDNIATKSGSEIYFECGETSGGTDKRGFTIQNNEFKISKNEGLSKIYLNWIKSSDFNFNNNKVIITGSNTDKVYFFEFSGKTSEVLKNSMNISSNCITSSTNICKSDD